MSLDKPTPYLTSVLSALERLGELGERKTEIEIEIARLIQYFSASVNLLAEDEQKMLIERYQVVRKTIEEENASLKDAVITALKAAGDEYLTTSDVLISVNTSFDFSKYSSKPLSSIYTTLQRLVGNEVERKEIDGVTVYRWKPRKTMPEIADAIARLGQNAATPTAADAMKPLTRVPTGRRSGIPPAPELPGIGPPPGGWKTKDEK